jgi:hypothetical protein
MRFRHLILLFALFLFNQSSFCQKSKSADTKLTDTSKANPSNLTIAKFQINDIKTRGIIIRLKTNKDRITAYRKAGYDKVANKMEEKATATNLILMYAFLTHWSYCPLYFMESQNTLTLLTKDTLIAKTFDLKRDTAFYFNKDSFYILDYGVLMENEVQENSDFKDINKTQESNNPSSYDNLVLKDHNQNQLQAPMPFFAKVIIPELTNTENIEPISLSKEMNDSIIYSLDQYKTITALMRSPCKGFAAAYLDSIFAHIVYVNKNIGGSNKINKKLAFGEMGAGSGYGTNGTLGANGAYGFNGATVGGAGAGNPFQRAVKRLNNSFIEYYCKRLDKDKNILSRDDIEYWWQRNPNIQYFPYLHDLEVVLKAAMESTPKTTKKH